MTLAVARFSSLLFLLLFLLFSPGDARKRLRVIRGYAASTVQFKNLALIRIFYNNASVTVCTGSLVDLSHVLTAAHCKRTFERRDANTSIQVFLGATYVSDTMAKQVQAFTVNNTIVPSELDPNEKGSDYDIMILRLSGKAKVTTHVRPVILAKCRPPLEDQVHNNCFLVGYGRVGEKKLASSLQMGPMKAKFSDTATFSAYPAGRNKSSGCIGDSGAPLLCLSKEKKNTIVQAGVLSGGNGICGNKKKRVQYVSTAFHRTWILNNLRD